MGLGICKSKYEIWLMYLEYLNDWIDDHKDTAFYSQSPACFDEWYDNEFKELL